MKTRHLIIMGLLLGIVFLFSVDKCGQSNKYQRLRGEYEALDKMFEMNREASKNVIEGKDQEIINANKRIKELESSIVEKNDKLITKDEKISDIEGAYDETATLEEKIANLKRQVKLWKEKFQIAEGIIAEKDKIIFSLTEKYEAQLIISGEWRLMYENELKVRDNLEAQIKVLGGRFRTVKFVSKVKTGFFVIAVGILAYKIFEE